MREFWDARASEDAYYFVDNRLDYRHPDVERFWAGGEQIVTLMLDELGVAIAPTDTVVDIGCGLGRVTRAVAARGAVVIALDISPQMLAGARELNSGLDNVEWVIGDGRTLAPVDSGGADVCISYVTFHHIPDPEITFGYVREMGRVLRPGGFAAFQVSNLPALHERVSPLRRLRTQWRALRGLGPGGQDHPAWRGAWTDLDRLREVAAEAGLETERIVGEGDPQCFVLLRAGGAGHQVRRG